MSWRKKKQILKELETEQEFCGRLGNERRSVQEELTLKKEGFHRSQSSYETLRNMAERYEGYGFGIKRVMEQKGRYPGIIGAVADIMKVRKNMSLLWRLPRRSHSECSHRYPADSKRNDRISEKKPIWQGDIPSAQRSQTEGRISKA